MSKPHVIDEKLSRIIDQQYRPGASVGSGSSADAYRSERVTGERVGGSFHEQKLRDDSMALSKWLEANPTARSSDRAAAENVLRDISNALKGN